MIIVVEPMNNGKAFLEDLLSFWRARLTDYLSTQLLSKEEKEYLEIIEGLLHSDAPYRLWEECQSGFIRKGTIREVEKVDEAIFKLKFRILPLPEEQKDEMTQLAMNCESLLVFCICDCLRKEGRLVE